MNNYPEEITLSFTSYAGIPFKAEIYSAELNINWGDGTISTNRDTPYCVLYHKYAQEGLYTIQISGHLITGLNVSHLSLTEISLFHCHFLEFLNCAGNELKELKLEECPSLTHLYCNSNNLRSLDCNSIPQLAQLNVAYNMLRTLNLAPCSALQSLYCPYNSLEAIQLSAHPSLYSLQTDSNLLERERLNQIFQALPYREENAFISYLDNPGSIFADTQILKLKKWL